MSKIPSPHFQMESWAIVFSIFSFINFGIVYIWSIYQSLDERTWFTILFFFIPKRIAFCLKYGFFLSGAPTSICHFFCPSVCLSVCRAPYLRNHASSNHSFWYTCVRSNLQVFFVCFVLCVCLCVCVFFFFFFEILIFWAVFVKGQKNSPKWKITTTSVTHHISQEQYSIWSWYLQVIFFFFNFDFWGC